MNKLIVPLLLILAFASTSCTDDTKEKIQKIAQQNSEQTGANDNKVILKPKLSDFCKGHECPEGIVAVKTESKKLSCSGVTKSATEVLISENCASSSKSFHVQTKEGELIKVLSIEDELTNEFGDKVLKLNLETAISELSNIDIPEFENTDITLFQFNDLGELESKECELTYASLAYANSFNNESQLLNIKNCDGVRDGALISQNGKTIGFLTKKHDEIDLYEGISLNGDIENINIMTKTEELSYNFTSNDHMFIGLFSFSYPLIDGDLGNERVYFNKKEFSFTTKFDCVKNGARPQINDEINKVIFDNDILEMNENTKLKTTLVKTYIPLSEVNQDPKLASVIFKKFNYMTTTTPIDLVQKIKVRNPFNRNLVLFEKYIFDTKKGHQLINIKTCK